MTFPARDGGSQPPTANGDQTAAPNAYVVDEAAGDETAAPGAYVVDEAAGDETAAPNAYAVDEAATADADDAALAEANEAAAAAGYPAEAGPAVPAVAGDRWSDITAMFVDDPRGSVEEASVMVDEAVGALIAVARQRQAALAASWQAPDADTERLRKALQAYRAFWTTVAQLPQPT
jgi:hypothetical protein